MLKNIICPHCGYKMPVYFAENAKCRGIFIRCKGRNCKKMFEIKIDKKDIK